MAFLRIAAALSFIGTRGLLICWSSFFDDSTAVAPEKVAGNTQFYIESLFRLLGVNFAAEGDKEAGVAGAHRQHDLCRWIRCYSQRVGKTAWQVGVV